MVLSICIHAYMVVLFCHCVRLYVGTVFSRSLASSDAGLLSFAPCSSLAVLLCLTVPKIVIYQVVPPFSYLYIIYIYIYIYILFFSLLSIWLVMVTFYYQLHCSIWSRPWSLVFCILALSCMLVAWFILFVGAAQARELEKKVHPASDPYHFFICSSLGSPCQVCACSYIVSRLNKPTPSRGASGGAVIVSWRGGVGRGVRGRSGG